MTPQGEAYVKHIKKELIPRGIETLYILGTLNNKDTIDNVCAAVEDTFEKYRTDESTVTLTYKAEGGEERLETREQYLLILRRRGIPVFQQVS